MDYQKQLFEVRNQQKGHELLQEKRHIPHQDQRPWQYEVLHEVNCLLMLRHEGKMILEMIPEI